MDLCVSKTITFSQSNCIKLQEVRLSTEIVTMFSRNYKNSANQLKFWLHNVVLYKTYKHTNHTNKQFSHKYRDESGMNH